jgi:SNF2 family DNA or RNA helicase
MFVVGPPSCFGPWKNEYKAVLGRMPAFEALAGGDIETRHSKYFADAASTGDLYLTSFQTLQRDWERVRRLFEHQGIRFFLIVDEAHYVKQVNGTWANAVLGIARYAARRCVLTGTPFPRGYEDGFNLFDVLWPESPPLSNQQRLRIVVSSEKRDWETAAAVMDASVGPLFYRVRKKDLKLAPQIMHEPVIVQMNPNERLVYGAVLDRVQCLSESDEYKNFALLERLRRGRMIRLRQCLSFIPLLATAVTEYEEEIGADDGSLSDIIKHYGQLETPGKLQQLRILVRELLERGEKVVIWSNFVKTLELIEETIEGLGTGVRLIYGATPIEERSTADEMTRERIVEEFVDPRSNVRVLVANPAACAESISLHKACSHAIYYDLSYNCAQYVQSMDRIHRVGGSESRPSHYYFLQYAQTIDKSILANVQRKAENMGRVIDQEFPVYTLDMFAGEEELEAYEHLFRKRKPV